MNAEDAVRQMEEPELLTEVPPILKRLAKTVAYAFYDPELVVTISLLTSYPCIDEDTLLEKLQFDKRQLRGVLSKLKNDKLVKQRQIKEKQPDTANFNVYNFYFINYKLFVNVVKYKLDHIRRKLETEEQQAQNRPSFQCLRCSKHFSDLEVDRLMDFNTNSMKCSFCGGEVEEDINHIKTQSKGSSLGRFNDQMESIYNLLKECENINLAPEVLEPSPSTASIKTSHKSTSSSNVKSGWASANSKVKDLYDQNIKINVGDDEVEANNEQRKVKDLPVWISESTVLNEESNDSSASLASSSHIDNAANSTSNQIAAKEDDHDIMSHLLAHENSDKKQHLDEDVTMVTLKGSVEQRNESDASATVNENSKFTEVAYSVDSDDDAMNGSHDDNNDDEDDEDKEDNMTLKIGDKQYSFEEITDEIIDKMTPAEHQTYLKMYNDVYEQFC